MPEVPQSDESSFHPAIFNTSKIFPLLDHETRRELDMIVIDHDRAISGFERKFELDFEQFAKIDHPNLMKLHNITKYQDQLAYTAERVRGVNLYEFIESETLEVGEALEIIFQVIAAFEALSQHGIFRSWIRPEHFVVNSEGRIKLVDYYLTGTSASYDNGTPGVKWNLVYSGYSPFDTEDDERDYVYIAAAFFLEFLGLVQLGPDESVFDLRYTFTANPFRVLEIDFPPYLARYKNALLIALCGNSRHRFQTLQEFKDALLNLGDVRKEKLDACHFYLFLKRIQPWDGLKRRLKWGRRNKGVWNKCINKLEDKIFGKTF